MDVSVVVEWDCRHSELGHVVWATVPYLGYAHEYHAPVGELGGLSPKTQRLILETGINRLVKTLERNYP